MLHSTSEAPGVSEGLLLEQETRLAFADTIPAFTANDSALKSGGWGYRNMAILTTVKETRERGGRSLDDFCAPHWITKDIDHDTAGAGNEWGEGHDKFTSDKIFDGGGAVNSIDPKVSGKCPYCGIGANGGSMKSNIHVTCA